MWYSLPRIPSGDFYECSDFECIFKSACSNAGTFFGEITPGEDADSTLCDAKHEQSMNKR